MEEQADEIKAAWREVADRSPLPWEWFCTLTFRRRTSYLEAEKGLLWWVRQVTLARYQQGLSMSQAKKKADKTDLPWIATVEPHKAAGTHLHVVVADVGDLDRETFKELWESKHGNARVEACADPEACVNYVLKWAGTVGEPFPSGALSKPSP